METLAIPCLASEGRPPSRIPFRYFGVGQKFRMWIFTLSLRLKPMASTVKLTHWLMAVASAAPETPRPAPKEARSPNTPMESPARKISIGSRNRFRIAPEVRPIIEKNAFP